MTELHYSPYTSTISPRPKRSKFLIVFLIVVGVFLCGWSVVAYYNAPPSDLVVPTEVVIESGSGVTQIADTLAEAQVIRSARWFTLRTVLSYDPAAFQAGVYEFTAPASVDQVIAKLQRGEALPQDRTITLVEGLTRADYANTLAQALPDFDEAEFLRLTSDLEGYLFPDTYRLDPNTTEEVAVQLLTSTFASRTEPLADAMATHSLTRSEIVNLASILEKEANSSTSMRMVSGILQNRLSIGMALQADATIGYVLDKPLSELVPADLDRESPYNTYLQPGLPPTPISNPGLEAIRAVLAPTPSDNFYYITGNDGKFYYAETYDEHQRNIARYLR